MRKVLPIVMTAASLMAVQSVLAERDDPELPQYKPYKELFVSIHNETGEDCIRVDREFSWGTAVIDAPKRINDDESVTFILANGQFTGPKMTVAYQCGNQTVKVENGMSLLVPPAAGGNVYAKVLDKTDKIHATHHEHNASWYYNEHGEIDWLFTLDK